MLNRDVILNGVLFFCGASDMPNMSRINQIRHEAETYLSHGLHQEALAVYEKFLSSTRQLHPSLKTAIKESIRNIRSAARGHDRNEAELISEVEIALIRKGWKSHVSNEERLASAQALLDIGFYQFALEEYRRLLKKRYITDAVILGSALCLVNLVQSKRFTVVVDHFVGEIFKHPRNRKALKLAIAKKIDSKQYQRHFSALCYHISELNLYSERGQKE
jgi:tetratricopeptide (TPR) repeat protein